MSISVSSRGASTVSPEEGIKRLEATLYDLQGQINGQSRQIGVFDGKLPTGASPGSIGTWETTDAFSISTVDQKRKFGDPFVIPRAATQLIAITRTPLPPSTTDLPSSGNFGWHLDTVTGAYYWAYNDAGTIVYPNFLAIAGTITDTQHGDRSLTVTTMHAFPQISGAITSTQHGNLSAAVGTFHGFAQISGTITDSQHGARGNLSGLAHANVTSTVDGFMSAAQNNKLGNYPADCTTVASDSNAVQRNAGAINATQYQISGTKVIGTPVTGYSVTGGSYSIDRTATTNTAAVTTQVLGNLLYTLIADLVNNHGLIRA